MTRLSVTRAGPLATLQDEGRFGMLGQGISASGPMDASAYAMAGAALDRAGSAAIEFSQSFAASVDGPVAISVAGGVFRLRVNGAAADWPGVHALKAGDRFEIAPGASGNYGYLRFEREIDVPPILGSRATNVTVGLGGYKGRPLKAGDVIAFGAEGEARSAPAVQAGEGPIRFVWGLHADLVDPATRRRFTEHGFFVSNVHDRMGVRLTDPVGVFSLSRRLSLVSDAIVPGDVQILGDGTPIVLMRDHQPTGGYPRIATVVSGDLDRFAQLRPGIEVRFRPISLDGRR